MGIENRQKIMQRIKKATEDSQIIVFQVDRQSTLNLEFNAFFANTIGTQDLIKQHEDRYIGIFHGQNGATEFYLKAQNARSEVLS